jgi:hypothetical protein
MALPQTRSSPLFIALPRSEGEKLRMHAPCVCLQPRSSPNDARPLTDYRPLSSPRVAKTPGNKHSQLV